MCIYLTLFLLLGVTDRLAKGILPCTYMTIVSICDLYEIYTRSVHNLYDICTYDTLQYPLFFF